MGKREKSFTTIKVIKTLLRFLKEVRNFATDGFNGYIGKRNFLGQWVFRILLLIILFAFCRQP